MRVLQVWLLLCSTALILRAQTTLGSAAVGGTVRDASGAAVPEAKVILTETARGLSRETTSTSAGSFLFPTVAPGVYSLRVSKESFEVYEIKGVQVEVGQVATLDVPLEIGQISTVLSVSADKVILLETESNAIGTVVDSSRVESLPLNGRDFLQLALLAGGSNPPTGRSDVLSAQVGHPDRGVIIDGNMATTTGYTINGIATRGGRLGESALNLSIADIDQFKVQQSFFMPDQGPNPSLVNVTTKGGTNQFHGQAFEFVRNGDFDARNFFAIAPEALKRNQFGGAVGGPIKKDKIWFFANYEGLRQLDAFASNGYTPTAPMFAGDFTQAGQLIYDPNTFSANTGERLPFPNNIIPGNRINSVSHALLKYYLPGASIAERPSNLFASPQDTLNDDQYGVRMDAALTSRQNIFGQVIHENSPAVNPGIMPYSGAFYPSHDEMAMMQHTWTPRPDLVNTLRFGILRNEALYANQGRTLGDILDPLGIPNTKDGRGVIAVALTGFTGFGRANGDLGNIDNNYQLDDGVNYIHGKHNFQFGIGIRYRRTWQQNANAAANGALQFQAQYTAQLAPNAQDQPAPRAGTGNAFADYLLGMPTVATTSGLPMVPYRFTQFMPYFEDTWKITRNLTLNYGISWFLETIPNPQGMFTKWAHGFNFQTGLLTYAELGQIDPKVLSTDLNNFTPRIGFAWKPDFLPNTVIRSGAGLYYADDALIELQFGLSAPPFTTPITLVNNQLSPLPAYQLGVNIFPAPATSPLNSSYAASLPNGTSAFLLNPAGRTPYQQQWNFSIQHSFTTSDVLELAYLGSSDHKLQDRYDIAACRPSSDLRCDPATKPYPRYAGLLEADFDGNSSYEALVAKFRRRAARGLNFNAEYTFAKALTDGWESSSTTDSQYASCRSCDKGPASFDVRHHVVLSTVYDIPVGRGRTFGRNLTRAADLALGGWILTGITSFSTGPPIFITSPNTTSVAYTSVRANRLCNGSDAKLSGNLRTGGFIDFDTSCFASPSVGYFGTSGRSPINGPGVNNWDLGLEKTFAVHDQTRFEFRGEVFNAFNHAQFTMLTTDTGSGANFGRISTARAPRLIQLGLKLLF